MNRLTAALTLGAVALSSPALAAPIAFEVFGHTFEIRSGDFEEELWLDGTRVHENGLLFMKQIGIVGTTFVIVGTSATGGNMCGAAPFVVSFPAGGAPVFDGPVDTCAGLTVTFEPDDILFQGTPSVLGPGEQWSWRPGAGFLQEAPIAFVPSTESGWAAITRGDISHPFDLLGYADILALGDGLMGDARNAVLLALSGPGSGERRGELYAGDACFPHNCPYSQALMVADIPSQRLFMAWRIDGVVTVVPGEEFWPKAAEQELRAWEARLVQ